MGRRQRADRRGFPDCNVRWHTTGGIPWRGPGARHSLHLPRDYFFANEYAAVHIGSRAFMLIVTVSAAVAVRAQFIVVHNLADVSISVRPWVLHIFMTVLTTVAPVVLLTEGVRRVGAQRDPVMEQFGSGSVSGIVGASPKLSASGPSRVWHGPWSRSRPDRVRNR